MNVSDEGTEEKKMKESTDLFFVLVGFKTFHLIESCWWHWMTSKTVFMIPFLNQHWAATVSRCKLGLWTLTVFVVCGHAATPALAVSFRRIQLFSQKCNFNCRAIFFFFMMHLAAAAASRCVEMFGASASSCDGVQPSSRAAVHHKERSVQQQRERLLLWSWSVSRKYRCSVQC